MTHYSYVWTAFNPPFNAVANWVPDPAQNNNPPDPFSGLIDTTFPKGVAFQDWLSNVGALKQRQPDHQRAARRRRPGEPRRRDALGLRAEPEQHHDADHHPAPDVEHAGVPAAAARWRRGRGVRPVVFSDFHVTAAGLANNLGKFPSSCKPGAMSPQEKALGSSTVNW